MTLPYIEGLRTPPLPQLHIFLPQRAAIHTFQGYYSNYGFVQNLQRVFAWSSPFPRHAFVSPSYDIALHAGSANTHAPLTHKGHQSSFPLWSRCTRETPSVLWRLRSPSCQRWRPATCNHHTCHANKVNTSLILAKCVEAPFGR